MQISAGFAGNRSAPPITGSRQSLAKCRETLGTRSPVAPPVSYTRPDYCSIFRQAPRVPGIWGAFRQRIFVTGIAPREHGRPCRHFVLFLPRTRWTNKTKVKERSVRKRLMFFSAYQQHRLGVDETRKAQAHNSRADGPRQSSHNSKTNGIDRSDEGDAVGRPDRALAPTQFGMSQRVAPAFMPLSNKIPIEGWCFSVLRAGASNEHACP